MTAEMEQSHWLSDVIIESRYWPEIFEFYSFAFCNLSYSLGDRNDRCSAAFIISKSLPKSMPIYLITHRTTASSFQMFPIMKRPNTYHSAHRKNMINGKRNMTKRKAQA